MIKSLAAFFFCLLLAFPAFSQLARDKNEYRFKGVVQSILIEESKITVKEGKAVESPRIHSSEYTFNLRGQLTESLFHNYDGSLYAKYKATYDDKGNKIDEAYYDPEGDVIDKMIYTYDPNGKLIDKTVEKARNSPNSKAVCAYDGKGRIIERTQRNIQDPGGYKIVFAYDDSQNKLEEISYDLKGSLRCKVTHKYDDQMRLIERESCPNKGGGPWKYYLNYDANGNLAEETFKVFDAVSKWRYEYELDANGNWTKRITYSLVNRDGATKFEPIAVTYQRITYSTLKGETGRSRAVDLASIVAIKETSSYLPAYAIKREEAVYQEEARRQGLTGQVNVYVLVDETGEVVSASVAPEAARPLRDAAAKAALRWKLNPTLSGGISVRFVAPVVFDFPL